MVATADLRRYQLGNEPGTGCSRYEPQAADNAPIPDSEHERIATALAASGGRKGDAAERLGISRSTLWRKMRELGLG